MKHNLVYKLLDHQEKMEYIGIHATNDINDGYETSGAITRPLVREFGYGDRFEYVVLFDFDNDEEMYAKEAELVNKEYVAREDTYNQVVGGNRSNFRSVNQRKKEDKEFAEKCRLAASESRKGKIYINNGKTVKMVDKDSPLLDSPEWDLGRLKGQTVKGRKWYHNDETSIMAYPDDPRLQEGEWEEGRGIAKNKDRVWINNGSVNKMVHKESDLLNDPDWVKGAVKGSIKNYVRINNGKVNTSVPSDSPLLEDPSWKRGILKFKEAA